MGVEGDKKEVRCDETGRERQSIISTTLHNTDLVQKVKIELMELWKAHAKQADAALSAQPVSLFSDEKVGLAGLVSSGGRGGGGSGGGGGGSSDSSVGIHPFDPMMGGFGLGKGGGFGMELGMAGRGGGVQAPESKAEREQRQWQQQRQADSQTDMTGAFTDLMTDLQHMGYSIPKIQKALAVTGSVQMEVLLDYLVDNDSDIELLDQ
jgi:hypothetical protein